MCEQGIKYIHFSLGRVSLGINKSKKKCIFPISLSEMRRLIPFFSYLSGNYETCNYERDINLFI